jgi:hypothetical protein
MILPGSIKAAAADILRYRAIAFHRGCRDRAQAQAQPPDQAVISGTVVSGGGG